MLKMFLSLMVIFLSIYMIFINHPISMGLMILTQTLFICLLLGMFINSYWFSYILFLIFLGGLLVLFIYISSIASNEMMKFSINKFIIIIPILILFILFFYNLNWLNFSFNEDMMNFNNMFFFLYNENYINLFKLYDKQTYLLMYMMIIYLFITLIAVVKITNIFFGPLRSFN